MSMPAMAVSLDDYLTQQRRASDAAMVRVIASINGHTRVADAMRYALNGGGKRLRPALCSACYEAVTRKPADDNVADLGCAVELIHTYSLVHDDLPCMDDDDVRRGRATTHRVFGDDVATLAGAALIPLAFGVASRAAAQLGLADAARLNIMRALARAAGAAGMVGGQVLDLVSGLEHADLDRLERMHQAKTGALLGAACRIGALAAHANASQLAAIDAYGRHLGLAFQITDDILDVTASTEQLGKTAGKDRADAKATFPALMGVSAAIERAVTEINAGIGALQHADIEIDTLARLGRFAVERKQ